MFKTTFIIVLAVLCLNFSTKAQAQQTEFQPLKIGDTIPEKIWNLPLQIRNHPEGKQQTTLNAYKGKLIILDFWATWCKPCLAMLPKTNALQKKYGNQVQFLPVTREPETIINQFMQRTGWNPMQQLSYVPSDTALNQLFLHHLIPHYAWISPAGVVKAITESGEINESSIDKILSGKEQQLPLKQDEAKAAFDSANALINRQPAIDTTVLFSATLTPYRKGWPSLTGFGEGPLINRRLLIINDFMMNLFRMAYSGTKYYRKGMSLGYPYNRTIVAIKNPERWLTPEKSYCYEQVMPTTHTESNLKMMQQQLELLLPFKAGLENRNMPCYIIVQEGNPSQHIQPTDSLLQQSPLYLTMHNQTSGKLAEVLNRYLGGKKHIIIDETGITQPISLELKTQLTDLQAVKTALQPWGLTLKAATRNIEVLVITDKKSN